jgi:hypothetical protein
MNTGIIPLVAVVIALGGSLLWGLVATITHMVISISRQRAEANLKLEMIRRGYSASEIERICGAQVTVDAKLPPAEWTPVTPPPKPAKV